MLSASDAVLDRTAVDGRALPADSDASATILQLSVGGRFEDDGSFHGTRWQSVAVERAADEEPEWESTPSEPSPDDVDGLRAVVGEFDVDIYRGSLEGLITAEIEFDSEQLSESFEPPEWLGTEVTGEAGYANKNLATRGIPRTRGGSA